MKEKKKGYSSSVRRFLKNLRMYGLDKDEHRVAQWPETKKEEADEFTAGRSCFVNVGRCEDKRGTRSSGAETVFSSLFAFFCCSYSGS